VCKWLDRPEEEAVPGLGALTVRTEACLLPMYDGGRRWREAALDDAELAMLPPPEPPGTVTIGGGSCGCCSCCCSRISGVGVAPRRPPPLISPACLRTW